MATAIAACWTVAQAAQTAFEALDDLLRRHAAAEEKARAQDVDGDVVELFGRVARLVPAGLTRPKVEHSRLKDDGRPVLLVEGWVIGEDANGDVMVVQQDGGQVGHFHRGRIEVLADRDLAIGAVAALN